MPQISTELDQLSIALIQTAIDMLDVHDDVPVMLAVDCDGELLTFEDDTPDGCYRAAREQVRSYGKDCVRYALLTQGFVQEDETDSGQPALLFEFAERGMDCAWSGFMLYRRDEDGHVEVSDPLPAGEEELLFG